MDLFVAYTPQQNAEPGGMGDVSPSKTRSQGAMGDVSPIFSNRRIYIA